ncbi:hypothetical protein GCM10010495_68700 [Kitasatospora herbaricolor]|nr:hypothetical protein GCM10010495_68700 [Kitasatospora herbaricolor]
MTAGPGSNRCRALPVGFPPSPDPVGRAPAVSGPKCGGNTKHGGNTGVCNKKFGRATLSHPTRAQTPPTGRPSPPLRRQPGTAPPSARAAAWEGTDPHAPG